MKKKLSLVAMFVIACLTFSCKKDPVTPEPEYPEKFSAFTVEQNKAKLEDNGIQLIGEVSNLHKTAGVESLSNLGRLLSYTNNSQLQRTAGGNLLQSLNTLNADRSSANNVFDAMQPMSTQESGSLQEFFDENAGTYTWVAAREEWDFVAGGKSLIFKFPSKEGRTTNDATFTIKDYQGKIMSNPADYTGDLPTNLVMDLVVGTNKVMDYSFKASYNAAGEPNSMTVNLNFGTFAFATKFSNDTKTASVEHSLKNNGTTLIALGSTVKGDLKGSNVENAEEPSSVINETSAYFQFMNIKIAGMIDVKGLYADGFENANTPAKRVELLNKHYKLMAYYADSKEKIADTEFYTYQRTVTYYENCRYNQNWDWVCDEKQVQETTQDIRLVFADQSKSDLNNYFANGFSNLSQEFEAFINSL